MRIGDAFKKAKGLFVEEDESGSIPYNSGTGTIPAEPRPAAKTVEEVARAEPGPNLDQIQAPADPTQPVIDADGSVHFDSIYKLAALPVVPFTSEQVMELLASLPAELPLATKRATFKITVDTMAKTTNVTTQAIVADASRKMAALAAYEKSYEQQVTEYASKSEAEIALLETQIAARRGSIEDAKKRQELIETACTTEGTRLHEVLEFLTLDNPPKSNPV